ncbi:threonine/homoserine/homoserine lactone efflux protein [Shimia isoporae]|uniref:Threonine/homoserine/homoserine lactone efflux protein n=1 Tax=Shimia isoporae TaxID=647720 RepID=A0A4R1N4F6_9RHOB|nr:LysE family translocator [Shimia isoporae]TCL00643.1 threonine/homoserine/homoserine lactone efflux protein [Shimia isoporae]
MLETFAQMDSVTLWAFMAASLVMYLTPGADMMFTIASGISGGPKAGFAATVGVTLGLVVHITLAAAGLAVLIAASPTALLVIRYAGAAYLVVLAYQAWTAKPDAEETEGRSSVFRAVRRGFLTNMLNPKIILFILAFLPQFTTPEAGPIWQQIVILGVMFASGGFVVVSIIGLSAGVVGAKLKQATGVLNKIAAVIFGGLAAKLVFD